TLALLNPRIVGGADASPGTWPWQALLAISDSNGSLYQCGGSLINHQWILTAAHSFDPYVAVNLTQVQLNVQSIGLKVVYRNVVQVEIHPNYSPDLDNDIALMKMSSPVIYTHYINPICLAGAGSTFHTGVNAWVSGWGTLESGAFPDKLQEVSVPIIGDNQCKCYLGLLPNKTIVQDFLCRIHLSLSPQGDSGGPLMVQMYGVWIQAGVVSFGYGCAGPNSPGVYTEVSEFQGWIESVVGKIKEAATSLSSHVLSQKKKNLLVCSFCVIFFSKMRNVVLYSHSRKGKFICRAQLMKAIQSVSQLHQITSRGNQFIKHQQEKIINYSKKQEFRYNTLSVICTGRKNSFLPRF
uniref:Peptidase S1 domain-containing protein n=1 Tax=Neogobius melanostomus TaxID=47308 RepID=A0A8C6WQ45_9GOBI